MSDGDMSESVQVHRHPERGHYDRETIDAVLDASIVCHVASIDADGRPLVLPTLHARVDDVVYFHGSSASRNLKRAGTGVEISLAVTILDGLVLAHRIFSHSANYRSVVLRGCAELVTANDEKRAALRAFTQRLLPGRWDEALPPDDSELKATTVLRLPIKEASAKIRTGWPGDVEDNVVADDTEQVWVGVVPLSIVAQPPLAHPALPPNVPVSPAVARWLAEGS